MYSLKVAVETPCVLPPDACRSMLGSPRTHSSHACAQTPTHADVVWPGWVVGDPKQSSAPPDQYGASLTAGDSTTQVLTISVAASLAAIITLLACCCVWAHRQRTRVLFYLHATGSTPSLALNTGRKYHLFLSHVWSTGQGA